MKINSLLENQTTSSAISNTTTSAPKFGRDDEHLEETSAGATGSGSVASVASPVGKVRSRGSIFSGIKTSEKFPNSVSEETLPISKEKQKYIQAAKDVLKGADYDKQPQFFAEKFAELIIRECANFSYSYTYNDKNFEEWREYGWDCMPGDLRNAIMKHFGVEQ